MTKDAVSVRPYSQQFGAAVIDIAEALPSARLAAVLAELTLSHGFLTVGTDLAEPCEQALRQTGALGGPNVPIRTLRIGACPSWGCRSIWVDREAAYNDLSPRMKAYLDGLTLRMAPDVTAAMAPAGFAEAPAAFAGTGALVRRHPERTSLFLDIDPNGEGAEIDQLPPEESAAILSFLTDLLYAPHVQAHATLSSGAMALWDPLRTLPHLVEPALVRLRSGIRA